MVSSVSRDGVWEARARRWLDEPLLQFTSAGVLFAAIAVLSASQLYANWIAAGLEASWRSLVAVRLVDWLLWAAMTPFVIALDARVRRRARPWYLVTAIHLTAATLWFAAQNGVLVALTPLADSAATAQRFIDAYLARAALRFSTAWVVYAAVLAVAALLRDFVRRQRLTRDLYDAQLRALRGQIHPHFLFNTLHTVAGLVRSGDRDQAIGTIVALSDLLRRSLSHIREDEVPLEDEVDFLEAYLAIQRARFGEHLRVGITIQPETRGARVPPLIIQPVVENAIRHGLDLDHEPGSVSIHVGVHGTRLRIRVEDDGGNLADEHVVSADDEEGGFGLSNLRDRLVRLYGTEHVLKLGVTERGATAVVIEIPLRRS